jgi:hypothetical protein
MAQQMMCRFFSKLVIALAALLLAAPPAQSLEIKGKDAGSYEFPAQDQLPGFNYQVAWKVWTLMGSVITDAQIKWQLPDGARLPLPEPPGGYADKSSVPQSAWERISLYDVKLQVVGHLKNRSDVRYSIIIDLGVPWKPGAEKWSFNVPGSPEWDKLVSHFNPGGGNNGQYLSASEAKSLFKDGFIADQTSLIDPKLSLVVYFDKLLEGRADWRTGIMRRTVTDQIGNIERYAGLPTAKLQERLDRAVAALKENPKRIPDDLQRLFDKLNAGIPDKYIRPARRELYSRERDKAADKGRTELKLLLPGGRSDGYAAWRDAKQAELKKRKPPVDFADDKIVGFWVNQPESFTCQLNALKKHRWEFRGDGRVRFISTNGVVLFGTWFPNPDVQPNGKGTRTVELKHNGKKFRQIFTYQGEQKNKYDPVFKIHDISMPSVVERIKDMEFYNSLCPVKAGWFRDTAKW